MKSEEWRVKNSLAKLFHDVNKETKKYKKDVKPAQHITPLSYGEWQEPRSGEGLLAPLSHGEGAGLAKGWDYGVVLHILNIKRWKQSNQPTGCQQYRNIISAAS